MAHRKPHRRTASAPGGRHQQGATLIFVAGFLVVLVATLGLAIEVGRLYSAQSQLQKAANLAALEAARHVSGCAASQDGTTPKDAAIASLKRRFSNGKRPTIAVSQDDSGKDMFDTGVTRTDTNTSKRIFDATPKPDEKPTAVRLQIEGNDYSGPLLGMFGSAEELKASAGAINRSIAGIQLGTTLANVDLDRLGNLIGANIPVASAGNLADASIELAELLGIEAAVATTDDVAKVTVKAALGQIRNSVNANLNTPARGVVDVIKDQLGDTPLSEILSILGETGSDVSVSAGSIVNAAAQLVAADRKSAVRLPLNDVNLPANLGGLSADLRILQPPQMEVGPAGTNAQGKYYTSVKSAQVALTLNLELGIPVLLEINLPIGLRIADGTAQLQRITCPTATSRRYQVVVRGDTTVTKAGVGKFDENGFQPNTVTVLRALGIPLLQVKSDGLSEIESKPFVTDNPPFSIANQSEVPVSRQISSNLNTGDLASLLTGIDLTPIVLGALPLPVGDLLEPINTLLQKTLAPVLAPVLDPILNTLGVSLGNATVSITSVNADQPSLICTSHEQCFGHSSNGP